MKNPRTLRWTTAIATTAFVLLTAYSSGAGEHARCRISARGCSLRELDSRARIAR